MTGEILLEEMRSRIGINEIRGRKHNQEILEWFAAVGHPEVVDDETAHCSAGLAAAALKVGLPIPPRNTVLMARSWLTWGVRVDRADIQPSDIAVWPRGNPAGPFGHVNVVEKVVGRKVICIGANQATGKGCDGVTRSKLRAIADAR